MREQILIDGISYSDLLSAIDSLLEKKLEILFRHKEDRMLTRSEVAELLNISEVTLWRKVNKGIIKEYGTENGGHPRYKLSEIMHLKENEFRNARIRR